jgi:hypothetical protein
MFTIVNDTEESFHVPILVCLQPLSIQSLKVPFLLPEKNKVERINVLKLWVRYKNDGLRTLDFFNTLQNIARGL